MQSVVGARGLFPVAALAMGVSEPGDPPPVVVQIHVVVSAEQDAVVDVCAPAV